MKKILILIIFLPLSSSLFSQFNWINPLPQGNTLRSVHFLNSDTGFCAGNHGTFIKSVDGGTSWKLKETGISNDLNDVFFLDGNYGMAVGTEGMILKSSDGGDSWSTISAGISSELNSVHILDQDNIIITGYNGLILKSDDGGLNWISLQSNTTDKLFAIDFPTTHTGYIAGGKSTQGGPGVILKSIDKGDSWSILTDSTKNSLYHCSFTDSLTGYAAGNFGYIIKTIDGGLNWNIQDSPIDNHHIRCIAFEGELGFTCDFQGKVMRTDNGGLDWMEVASGSDYALFSIDFINSLKPVIVGTGGKINISNDLGFNFHSIQSGTDRSLMEIFREGNDLLIGGREVFLRSNDGGNSWNINSPFELQYANHYSFISKDIVYLLASSSIYKSTDGGQTWSLQGNIYKDNYNQKAEFLSDLYMISETTGFISGGGVSPGGAQWAILLKTIDAGVNWSSIQSPVGFPLNKIYFSDNDNGYILLSYYDRIITSNDGGNSWGTKPLPVNMRMKDIYFPNVNTGYLVGIDENDDKVILKSIDNGNSWDVIHSEPGSWLSDYYYLVRFYDEMNGYVMGIDNEIMQTTDGGNSWTHIQGITDNYISGMTLFSENSGILAGNYGSIISMGTASQLEEQSNSPEQLSIYPNPSKGWINIKLNDPSSHLHFTICNANSQIIDDFTLQNNGQTASYSYSFDQKHPNGVYCLKINTRGKSYCKKIVLLR